MELSNEPKASNHIAQLAIDWSEVMYADIGEIREVAFSSSVPTTDVYCVPTH